MRIGTSFALAAVTAATLFVPSAVSAQTLQLPENASFLVAGLAGHAEQGGQQSGRGPSGGGIGLGVKGGVLFSSFREARTDYKNSSGWQGTLFIGGNRSGSIGLATELTYAKRGAKSGSLATDTYYLEVPLLIRENFGSHDKDKGAIIYLFAGPAADILLKAQLNGLDIKSQYKSVDWNVLAGAGVEISRILVEGRFNWGLANVLEGPGNALKTRSFAILGGIRFN